MSIPCIWSIISISRSCCSTRRVHICKAKSCSPYSFNQRLRRSVRLTGRKLAPAPTALTVSSSDVLAIRYCTLHQLLFPLGSGGPPPVGGTLLGGGGPQFSPWHGGLQ